MVEWVTSKRMDEVEDGKIEVIGPEITDVPADAKLPMAIAVEVAGREMQEDYEPILERQIHHLINYRCSPSCQTASGLWSNIR